MYIDYVLNFATNYSQLFKDYLSLNLKNVCEIAWLRYQVTFNDKQSYFFVALLSRIKSLHYFDRRVIDLASNKVFHVMFDTMEGLEGLIQQPLNNGRRWSAFLEIDCGYGRSKFMEFHTIFYIPAKEMF